MAALAARTHEMGTGRSIALAIAVTWCIVLVAGAFLVPVYSSSGSAGDSTNTLVGVNGVGAVGVIVIPLLVTAVVGAILWRRRFASGAGPAAWTVVGLTAAFNLLGMLTIGVFILPVTVSLIVACAQPPTPSPALAAGGVALPEWAPK